MQINSYVYDKWTIWCSIGLSNSFPRCFSRKIGLSLQPDVKLSVQHEKRLEELHKINAHNEYT